jgi:predicted dehydrogenase
MTRRVGIGVIGLGWMGRVHTASYRRLAEHFPELDPPRLVVAADTSGARRAHAERVGFERTVDDWRAVLEDPAVDAVSITLPNLMHREVATAAAQAGKHLWVEKPVGRGLEDTLAVAEAVERACVISAVGFCYRFAPVVQHARALIGDGALGAITHYRATFLADYASDPRAAASWRFRRAEAGSGALGDLLAHSVDMTHFLAGPITRCSGRTAIKIAQRPAEGAEGTHFSRSDSTELVDVENEDWASALIEFGNGVVGSLEASRVIVGPHVRMRFDVHGTEGALGWDFERMNELERFRLGDDAGYTRVAAGPSHPGFERFQPGAGMSMGYDDLRVLEAANFLAAVRDGEQRAPGLDEMVATARVLAAVERSAASGAWEPV